MNRAPPSHPGRHLASVSSTSASGPALLQSTPALTEFKKTDGLREPKGVPEIHKENKIVAIVTNYTTNHLYLFDTTLSLITIKFTIIMQSLVNRELPRVAIFHIHTGISIKLK